MADWAFVLALKGTALKTDFESKQLSVFCGEKDGDCQGKSNYVGQMEDQSSSYFGGNHLILLECRIRAGTMTISASQEWSYKNVGRWFCFLKVHQLGGGKPCNLILLIKFSHS